VAIPKGGLPMLSIVIVNYNSAHLIIDCIKSIKKETPTIPYEIIVVDNDSKDNSLSVLKNTFSDVVTHQMGYNSGFARANNAGIRLAKGDIVLLLNPDTIILNNAIELNYLEFVKDSDYVACGVQLIEKDGKPQISGNFNMKGGMNTLLPLPYWGNFLRWAGYQMAVKKPNIQEATQKTDVDWINGAYLMVKSDAIDKMGGLDEDFFLFAEEIEWCSRLKKAGKLCVYGQYHVTHLQGEISSVAFDSPDKGYYNIYDKKGLQIMVSNFLRVRKQFGLGWFMFILLNYLFAIPVSLLGAIITKLLRPSVMLKEISMYLGFYRNMLIMLIKYTPKIISGKPYFYKVL
jgi:GT2 family glycosyltransferase